MPVEWREEMVIDNSVIDDDHRFLIEIINTYESAVNNKTSEEALLSIHSNLFSLLKIYAVRHFEREEQLQRHANYIYQDAHAHEHRDLMKKLESLSTKYLKKSDYGEISLISKELIALLKGWLVDHILKSDLRLRPFVKAMRPYAQKMIRINEAQPEVSKDTLTLDAQTMIMIRVRDKKLGRGPTVTWLCSRMPGLSKSDAEAMVARVLSMHPEGTRGADSGDGGRGAAPS